MRLVKATIRLKGGPGSGNYGHAGRPGKVGGSAPGGGASTSDLGLAKYLRAKRQQLETNGARAELFDRVRVGVESTGRNFNEDDVEMLADFLVRNPDRVDEFSTRYNIDLSGDILKQAADYSRKVDRDMARIEWDAKMRAVKDQGQYFMTSEKFDDNNSNLVGKTWEDAANVLLQEFGVAASDDNSGVDDGRKHESLSGLLNVLRSEPAVANVVRNNRVTNVSFIRNPPGTTYAAQYHTRNNGHGSITATQGIRPSTWVHELGHSVNSQVPLSELIDGGFGRGKRVSMYAWSSPDEDFAETFSAYITNRSHYTDWVPEKLNYIDELMQ